MAALYSMSPTQYGTNQERIRQQEQKKNTTKISRNT